MKIQTPILALPLISALAFADDYPIDRGESAIRCFKAGDIARTTRK